MLGLLMLNGDGLQVGRRACLQYSQVTQEAFSNCAYTYIHTYTYMYLASFFGSYCHTEPLLLMAVVYASVSVGYKKNSRWQGTFASLSKSHIPQAGFPVGLSHSSQSASPPLLPLHPQHKPLSLPEGTVNPASRYPACSLRVSGIEPSMSLLRSRTPGGLWR